MNAQSNRTILVIGATGAMGRPIIKHLLADTTNNWQIRAFTRNLQSPQAQQLVELGKGRVELFQGDLNDTNSVAAAMQNIYGVFCNTDFWSSCSVAVEREQGLRVLAAAKNASVQHLVYSSLESCAYLSEGKIPVAHFDSKAAVEHEIDWQRSHEFMQQLPDGWYSNNVTVLRTLAYFENLMAFFLPQKGTLSDGREGYIFTFPMQDAAYPFVALDDIAWFTTYLFANPQEWGGKTLSIGSELISIAELAATFEKVTGIPAEYNAISDETFLSFGIPNGHDALNQMRFHREYGPARDYAALRAIHPSLRTFEMWLKESGWRGEYRDVQKGSITGDS
ncbi:MAG TPA: NmrA/HSCARG family protein [Cyanobacteria bacterium UBA11372]|nr:NmrA/HSCARG family protein [Cyanobacteria bacterium UBA11372]